MTENKRKGSNNRVIKSCHDRGEIDDRFVMSRAGRDAWQAGVAEMVFGVGRDVTGAPYKGGGDRCRER